MEVGVVLRGAQFGQSPQLRRRQVKPPARLRPKKTTRDSTGEYPRWQTSEVGAVRLVGFCQPPAQYVQPPSCARFTPQVPDGIIVIPGITLASHSLAASSAPTPALLTSILLWTCSATLQAPNTTPLASNRSRAISSTGRTPAFGRRKGFFFAGALVSGSMILNDSPILYFSHIALSSAIGKAPWRKTTTAVADSFGARNVYANASGNPELASYASTTWRCRPFSAPGQSGPSARAVGTCACNGLGTSPANPRTATPPRRAKKRRRGVTSLSRARSI